MRSQAVASFVVGTVLASIIATIPARARAQGAPPGSASAPDAAPLPAPAAGESVASPAAAPEPAPPPPAGAPVPVAPAAESALPTTPKMVASLSHDLQFGLAVLIGGGYRFVFPYHRDIVCGDAKAEDNRVCTNRAPFFIDIQPSFGIANAWDALLDVRVGIDKDFNNKHQLLLMPGFRHWLDPQLQVKFFTTIQLFYDATGAYTSAIAPHPVKTYDLGFRNSNGLMVEIMRNFGVYIQFGETVGFVRWLSFAADAGIGVQARVP
jgi:hypothetical protein